MKIIDIANINTEKIESSLLTRNTYISTENMLSNCGGVEVASSIPTGKVTSFCSDDTLISNIRPYFKKVWYARFNGGCSNDVICVRTKSETCLPAYLYYALCTDKFIDTFSASSKGTKMPRGDKNALLSYEIPDRTIAEQQHIVDILGSIDEKLEYYDNLIRQLELEGELQYKSIFENSSLARNRVELSSIASFYNGYSYSGEELCDNSQECLVTIKNFDRNGGFKIDGFKPIQVSGKIKPDMYVEVGDLLVAHTDLTQNADIIGNPILLLNLGGYERAIISMDLVKVKSDIWPAELLYFILKNIDFKAHSLGYCAGTTVLHLSKKALQEYSFNMPSDKTIVIELISKLQAIIERIKLAHIEIQKLNELKRLYLLKFFG